MAKRFTDTGKWDKGSFMALSPEMKLAWLYLCDKCDHAGVWDINLALMALHVGTTYSLGDLEAGLGNRIQLLSQTKLFVVDFVLFQYGKLNPENKVHRSVLLRHEELGIVFSKPLASPLYGAKDKDKEKDKEKEKETESAAQAEKSSTSLVAGIAESEILWAGTLEHFGIHRKVLASERTDLGRAIQRHGVEAVRLALYGARFEPVTEGFHPKDYVSLSRIFTPRKDGKLKLADFVNWGARAEAQRQTRMQKQARQESAEAENAENDVDPAVVRAILEEAGFKAKIPKGEEV